MFILHGSWLLTGPTDEARGFVLWAETDARDDVTSSGDAPRHARAHPFAATLRALRRAAFEFLPPAEDILKRDAKEFTVTVWLPSTRRGPQASPGLLRTGQGGAGGKLTLRAWQVNALLIPPYDVPGLLLSLPAADDATPGIQVGADLQFWNAAAKFALELLARQRYAPTLVERDASYLALWQPLLDEAADSARFDRLAQAMPPLCRALSLTEKSDAPAPQALLENFLSGVVDDFAREHSVVGEYKFIARRVIHGAPAPTIAEAWIEALNEVSPVVKGSRADLRAFYEQYRAWYEPIPGAGLGDTFRLCFRLDPPPPQQDIPGIRAPKPNAREWKLQYLLQATDDPSLLVPAETVWRERGSTLKFLNRKFDAPQERLLAGLGQASRLFPPIDSSLLVARPESCALNVQEAYTFIRETAVLLQSSGFGVLVPGVNAKLGVRVSLKPKQKETPKGGVAGLTFESVVQYDWQLALGSEPLSREEFEKLASLKVPLVQIRGQWVELKPEQIEQAIKFWEKRKGAGQQVLSLQEAMRLALSLEPNQPTDGLPVTQVVTEGWMDDLLRELTRGERMRGVPVPREFKGTLRPYQERGLAWLAFLRQWGLGACLADDMGLGKCISADSLIAVNGIPRSAEEIWHAYVGETQFDGEGFWAAPSEQLLVNAIDEKTGQIACAPIRRLYRQQVRETLRTVKLEDGSSITITRRHRLLTNKGWTNDLRVGDYVCVPARTLWVGEPADPDLVEFMAWQIAEGYEQSDNARLSITQHDVARLEELRRMIQRIGARYGIKINQPTIRKESDKAPELRITSRAYQRFLESQGYRWGKLSRDKAIPPFIMQADRENVRLFLRNYFDAEASAVLSMMSVEISSASPLLMQQLAMLLRRFGIWMRTSAKRKRATNGSGIYRIYYIGIIGGNSARRFCAEIGFGRTDKQQLLEKIGRRVSNTNVEGIPASDLVADAVRTSRLPLRHFGMHNPVYIDGSQQFSRTSLERVCSKIDRILSGETKREYQEQKRSKWTSRTLAAYEGLDKDRLNTTRQQLQRLLHQEVFYCRIKAIEDVGYDGWVYDLEVSGHHNFVANNILCHNTVQVAALFLHEGQTPNGQRRPALVICPTSVVSNWQRELARFSPDLRVLVHHGAARKKANFAGQATQHDVVISSYALLRRDEKHLAEVEWGDVILDEAQNIKNPSTRQAQVARKLPAQWRAALTGTPVENRLAELWSLFQFLNPGYLGSQEAFRKQLANPIERAGDPEATKQLKALVGPFILRRVKTDPTVIADLPQKNEMKVYCNLTKEQATLYEAVVRDSIQRIEDSEGIERRGIVLATLMKLKQVCNHPAQFLGDGSALPGRSGKLARLTEMLEEVRAVRERVLVFTQFAEMGKLLQAYLQTALGDEALFLYGGTPAKARTGMIERFQDDPHGPMVFILSIKAGGTGLNLTRANHVFHFDRWWNPAVENQATDRAFRIGQTKNVQVYKYLCAGTFEEKIDDMIERKKALAETIIGTSEAWITELSTEQLRELFTLRREAVGDE